MYISYKRQSILSERVLPGKKKTLLFIILVFIGNEISPLIIAPKLSLLSEPPTHNSDVLAWPH